MSPLRSPPATGSHAEWLEQDLTEATVSLPPPILETETGTAIPPSALSRAAKRAAIGEEGPRDEMPVSSSRVSIGKGVGGARCTAA